MKGYFNEEIQYISVKTLIYDIFTTNLNMESKAGFLASVYGEQREGFFMSEYTDNSFGKCKISRDKDGIEISYPRADGTKGEKRVDYRYCADLILHMIEENDYLTEGIFERFREAPGAFAAMPWFMEIYHEYKERMLQEPDFAAVSIDGQEEERQEGQETEAAAEEIPETRQTAENGQEEIPGTWQAVENGQEEIPEAWQTAESGQEETAETQQEETAEVQPGQEDIQETAERVEGEVINPDGSVAKPAAGSLFPEALRQVEEMDGDLRDALETYLTKCSAVVPYQPFLQMVAESSLPKEDKLNFLNRTINHLEDKEQTKAYHNNAYGLVEYIQNRDAFMVDLKSRDGERERFSATYEQLYSIMEYLIKAQMFTGEIRMSAYLRDFAKLPYEKMSALEKQFDDKLTSLRNRQRKGNFHFEEAELPKGGPKTRYQWNVEAIRLLKQIEYEGRTATPEEQKVLARYVGWGGIAQAFDERNEGWQKEYAELKELLSTSEYEDARETVNTAFYTSPVITQAVYNALDKFGFRKGTILEPALGVGHFFGTLPETMQLSLIHI